MGRLFQYNRFGKVDTNKPKKDTHQKNSKTIPQTSSNQCPAYSELYPEYSDYNLSSTCSTATPTVTTIATNTNTSPNANTNTTTTTLTSNSATKNVEIAFKKYQQWGSKLFHTITPAYTTSSTNSSSCNSSTSTSTSTSASTVSASISSRNETTATCTNCPSDFSHNTSGYYSHQTLTNTKAETKAGTGAGGDWGSGTGSTRESGAEVEVATETNKDTEELIDNTNTGTEKRQRVYDCMRDFLRRKFFQQNVGKNNTNSSGTGVTVTAEIGTVRDLIGKHEHPKQLHNPKEKVKDLFERNENTDDDDITSDYDEIDMLDSSYNADEEDATDCSCSYASEAEDIPKAPQATMPTSSNSISPQKPLLSFRCWQTETTNSVQDSTTEEDIFDEDSDAGISDCCQLIGEPKSPQKKKSPKRLQMKKNQRTQRFNISGDDLTELMEASWYQPRISTKAASQHLQKAEPGSFLVRRKSNCFELCLKSSNKIKHFTVIASEDCYKIKGALKQFSSLKALVTHHSVMAEQLPLTLALPREPRNRVSVRYADDFDTIESLQLLDLLKNLQAKHYDY